MLRRIFQLLLLSALVISIVGCSSAPVAKDGDKVKIHYVGTLDDGTEFDSSRGGDPLEFTLGAPGIIEGFQSGVRGMKVGEKKTIRLTPDLAYGMPRPELIQIVPRTQIPPDIVPEVGKQLTLTAPNGQMLQVAITAFDDSTVTMDANHPMAGKTLNFELELMEIVLPADSTKE